MNWVTLVIALVGLGISLATILWKMAASDARSIERQDNMIEKLNTLDTDIKAEFALTRQERQEIRKDVKSNAEKIGRLDGTLKWMAGRVNLPLAEGDK